MANKPIPKVPFDGNKFKEILKEQKLSIRKLCKTYELDRSFKTISRAIHDEEITVNSLNSICEKIGIDPKLLTKEKNTESSFMYIFDESSKIYSDDYERNKIYLFGLEVWATNKLVTDGYLYLNTILTELDIPIDDRAAAGWVYDKTNPITKILEINLFGSDNPLLVIKFTCMPDISKYVSQSKKLFKVK